MTQRTRIKFCGITRVDDALAAVAMGVDAIGLIFAEGSTRRLDIDAGAAIAAALPPMVTRVALFRDAPVDVVRAVLAQVRVELLQFHGDESPAYCAQFDCAFVRAVPMGALADAAQLDTFLQHHRAADGFVFDSHGGARSGGSGAVFDWSRVPRLAPKPVILAGGLQPHNVCDAIVQVRPWAVDVCSGIESAPGIKDHAKMGAFVAEVRRAGTH